MVPKFSLLYFWLECTIWSLLANVQSCNLVSRERPTEGEVISFRVLAGKKRWKEREKRLFFFFAKPMQIISYLIWTGNKAAVSAVWIWVITDVLPGTLLSTYSVFKNVFLTYTFNISQNNKDNWLGTMAWPSCSGYGNTGCGVFKRGVQN